MSCVRRSLGWLLFLGFLWAVGFGVFHFVRYRPRCTIPQLLFIQHLSADGALLVTVAGPKLNHAHTRGPMQVWDTRRGRLVHEFFRDVEAAWFDTSPDGRILAAGLDDGTLRLVDWRAGSEWRVDGVVLPPFQHRPAWPRQEWSEPNGRWLYVENAGEKPNCFIDGAKGKVVQRLPGGFLGFNADERLMFVGNDREIDVWDLPLAKKVATLPTGPQEWIARSPDGRSVLTRRTGPRPKPFEAAPMYSVDVWDLTSFKLRFNREVSPPAYWHTQFSPDAQRLALYCESNFLLVDANTGQVLSSGALPLCHHACFSRDSSLWLLAHGGQNQEQSTMFDAVRGQPLWQKPGRSACTFFGARGILHQVNDTVELLDGATGERLGAEPLAITTTERPPFTTPVIGSYLFTLTADGRQFAFAGRPRHPLDPPFAATWLRKWLPNQFGGNVPSVVVMESATGRELLRLANAGNQPDKLRLSDDASTLVTVDAFDDGRRLVRVWDVRPARAWLWAVGMASATGLGLLAVRGAWRRRIARKPANG